MEKKSFSSDDKVMVLHHSLEHFMVMTTTNAIFHVAFIYFWNEMDMQGRTDRGGEWGVTPLPAFEICV